MSLLRAAEQVDWQQVIANGGPPCFHIEDDGRFCLRAEQWEGHGGLHPFVTLHDAIIGSAVRGAKILLAPSPDSDTEEG